MAGPFPGMDPYLEFQGSWLDFHNRLVAEICNVLGLALPGSYVARVDERIEVVTSGEEPPRLYRPDVLLGRYDQDVASPQGTSRSNAALLEPELAEVIDRDPEELRITWVEVLALPDLELVTSIEVLSPVNKAWQGRKDYLAKRDQLHEASVNLVEIDLLLGGAPLPMKRPIPPGGYYAIVARGPRLPVAELYRWSVRDRLPSLPIPLREPDPDVIIDLAALVDKVYTLGRYELTLRRQAPLPEAALLAPDDRAWVEQVASKQV